MFKSLSRGMFVLYILILVWLILFKFSHDISSVLENQHRTLNLIPFDAPKMVNGRASYSEVVYNCIFFIPFGLLLNVNFKRLGFLPKLVFILVFSIMAEAIQYKYAIGATDITDVISNTTGGFLGLILYSLSRRFIKTETLDRIIISVGSILLVIFIAMHISHEIK